MPVLNWQLIRPSRQFRASTTSTLFVPTFTPVPPTKKRGQSRKETCVRNSCMPVFNWRLIRPSHQSRSSTTRSMLRPLSNFARSLLRPKSHQFAPIPRFDTNTASDRYQVLLPQKRREDSQKRVAEAHQHHRPALLPLLHSAD